MANILVFGGTGWVGHNIVLVFTQAGHTVTIATRGLKQDYLHQLGVGISMMQIDKSVPGDVARVFAERAYDVVIDTVPTEASVQNIGEHRHRVGHYLHCSSTGGYAPLAMIPGDESMPYDHFMGGWQTKQIVDDMVLHLHQTQGFPATIIRPTYITGPGMLPLDNLGDRRETFIPDILAKKAIDLPDNGLALLQPVHVRDLATMFRLAAERPKQSIGQIYNASLEKAVTLKSYIEITAGALGRRAHIHLMLLDAMYEKYFGGKADRGLAFLATHMCYDISKAKQQLGYQPHVTTEQAIAETARWAAEQLQRNGQL